MGTRRRRVSSKQGRSKRVKWDDLRMALFSSCTQDSIKKAAVALKNGHLVAFPTETVYGLGGDATNADAVSNIYRVKSRPARNPLIVHVSSVQQIHNWVAEIPEYALKLASKFCPGPLTLILKGNEIAREFLTGGQSSIGIRVPKNACAQLLLTEFESLGGIGVAAPSANMYKSISPTCAKDVWTEIGLRLSHDDTILDGGLCELGIESTIVNCLGETPKILRPGWVTLEAINQLLGSNSIGYKEDTLTLFPGSELSHYLPKTPVVINEPVQPGDGLIALSDFQTPAGVERLSSPDSLEQFATSLYSSFRRADELNLKRIVVILNETNGIGVAILDRVTKASRQ